MDTKVLLAELGHIAASAPNGVEQVRQLIMGLAFSGALVSPNEHLPPDIAVRLAVAREQYFVRLGRRSRQMPPNADPLIKEYEIPSGWRWVRVGDICDIQTGATPNKLRPEYYGGEIRWLVSGDINQGEIFECEGRISSLGIEHSNCKILPAGSVLIALNGQGKTRGSVAILRVSAACNQSLAAMIPFSAEFVSAEFLYLALRYRYFDIRAITGADQRRGLNIHFVSELSVPLPPLTEQARIVSKVEEMMSLCNRLQEQLELRTKTCAIARAAAFAALNADRPAQDFPNAWQRVTAEFHLLLDVPQSVQEVRGAILELAMSGVLSPPRGKAKSSGRELLRAIDRARTAWSDNAEGQERREAVSAQGKIRSQRLPTDGGPRSIPSHWAWATLLQVSQVIVDCHNKTAPYASSGIHLVRTTDIKNGQLSLLNTRKVSEETFTQWARRLPPEAGDIIFTREAPMGEAATIPPDQQVCLGQRTMLIRLFSHLFNPKFLLYVIYSPGFQQRLKDAAVGATVKHLRVGDVERLLVPVPPKDEQDRIVDTVESLFALCSVLEEKLSRKLELATQLASSVTDEFTGVRRREKAPMKVPKLELVSVLKANLALGPGEQVPHLTSILLRNRGEMPAKVLWANSGLEIDAFYQQLKQEMNAGWITQPEPAYIKEVEVV